MKEFLKKNFGIVLAFVLPIALIAVVALGTYFPSFFLSTDYNFVYAICTDGVNRYPHRCDNFLQERFSVVDGRLVVSDADTAQEPEDGATLKSSGSYTARLFLHDTEKNESREITVAEAQTLNLSNLLTSPDGVTVSSYYDRGDDFFFLFGDGSSYGHYLTKGKSKSKLNLINRDGRYYYGDNFRFIGWIVSAGE